MMRRSLLLLSAAAMVAGCGQANDDSAKQTAAVRPAKKKPAFCFFKDPDTKGWAASRDKDGNIVVRGKAYRQDPRYQAILGPATVAGSSAELSPTITLNDTGFGAPENWWDVSAIIPNSAAIDTVTVRCGARTLAELRIPPKS
jgi:hypothetical protein